MRQFIVKNLRKSIENLNKRIDELEAGDLDILKELFLALEFLLEEVGDPTPAIDKYNEIISFLDLIENTSKLKSLLDDIRNSIPEAPVQSDWAEDDVNDQAYIKNKPNLSDVATSGSYNDLSNKPDLSNVATSGSYEDLSNKPHIPEDPVLSDWAEDDTTDQAYIKNKPNLSTVATSGDYTDLNNKPTIPAALIQSDWAQDDNTLVDYIKNKPNLSTVATTGNYTDLNNKPTIPAEQIQSDWNQSDTTAKDYIKNKPSNATQSQSGLMSSADKTKLDGIETGAQAHQSPTTAEVKTALHTTTNTEKFLREDGNWVAIDTKTEERIVDNNYVNTHDYVEIDGIKWATTNVGASSVTDIGQYFMWGDPTPRQNKAYNIADHKLYNPAHTTQYNAYIKYNDYDYKGNLDLIDDAAYINWGGKWRTPGVTEYNSLRNNTNQTWTDDYNGTGAAGVICTDKTDSSKVLFLPATVTNDILVTHLWYWINSNAGLNYQEGGAFIISRDALLVERNGADGHCPREYVLPVRAVWDDSITPTKLVKDAVQDLSTVATTGSYNDLTDKPTIPTKVSDLTNNSDFLKNPHISNGHEYVEIGGIKWATMNVGASSETDKGLYFAWGETEGYRIYEDDSQNTRDFSESEYKYAELDGSTYVYTKYNSTDGKSSLDLEDDAARANWGGNWRIPTRDEFSNLFVNCIATIVRDSNNSAIGFLFTDKTDSTKSIYFPGCKGRKDGVLHDRSFYNSLPIWTNQRHDLSDYSYDDIAWIVSANYETTNGVDTPHPNSAETAFRYSGRPIRAILDEPTPSNTASKVAVTGDYNDLVNKPIIRVVDLTQNLANETSTISGVENSGKTEVVIYNNTTDESHFVIVSTINKTPTGKLLELIAPVGGYCEVSYINIGGVVFAKGLIVKNDDNNDSLYDNDGDWIIAEFDVDDTTIGTDLQGGLYSYGYLYGYMRLGTIVIDDVTVISASERNSSYSPNSYIRSFAYLFTSEGIHKVKYELTSSGSSGGIFRGCSKLVTVHLPSLETLIGREYFSGCTNLKRINSDVDGVFNIPNGVTYIGKDCFNGCNSLTTINIPESVSKISDYYIEMSSNGTHGGSVFLNCENLTTINVDSNNTIYDSRNNCNAIIKTEDNTLVLGCKNTTIPSTAINIGVGAFSGCKGMTSLTIPNNIVTINDRAFEYCDLQEINIPTSVKYIGESVFEGCSSLKRINSNTDGVFNVLSLPVTIGGVFSSASHVFLGCSLLDTLNISSTATEEISTSDNSYNTNILERTTSDCQGTFSKFNHITVDQNNSVYDSRNNCDAIIRTADNSLVVGCKNTVIPSTVTSIEYRAFNGCPVETITIPGTVTTIKAVAFDGASLRSVTIPEGTTTIEGGAFNKCNYLKTMSISSTVTSIGPSGLQNLSTITVDPNNTVYDSRDNCNAIIETSTNKLIMGASGTVVVPQTVTEIGTSAFAQRQISSITLPNSIVTIRSSAFTSGPEYESRVYKINSNENGVYNLPTGLKTIESSAFYGQKSLIELNLPEGITSLGTSCFESCSNLKRVNSDVDGIANIPESVTSISLHAFRFCDGISKIIFSSIVPPTMNSWTTLERQTIYVPTESLEAYKTAAGGMAGYIHPISELED